MLAAEQSVLNVSKKQLDIQQRLLNIRERRANLQLEQEMITYERENPLLVGLDKQRVEAEKRYELEKKLSEEKLAQVEAEKVLKLEMIDLEYALLDAKLLQTQLELKSLATNPELTPDQQQTALGLAAEIETARGGLEGLKADAKRAVKGEAENAVLAIVTNLDKLNLAKENLSEMGQLSNALTDSFSSGLVGAMDSVIQGTMSIKDAFKNMARSVLQALAQVIAKLIAIKLLEMAIGFFNFGGAAKVDAAQMGTLQSMGVPEAGPVGLARYGGVMKDPRGYSTGGIATGKDGGYPAILHGTEAVVPLPNNRSIPVDLQGNAGGTNNVTVNVTMAEGGGGGKNTSGDSQQGTNLGNAIAIAVQKELQNQKRSGGILSPYGVA